MSERLTSTPRLPIRRMSLLIFALLLVMTLIGAWAIRVNVRDQEHRLLGERTREVGLVLTSSISSITSSLDVLGGIVGTSPDRAVALELAAAPSVAAGPGRLTYALVRAAPGGFVVLAAEGAGLRPGQVLTGVRAATLTQSLTTPKMVPTPVIGAGANRVLGFAIGPPVAPTGEILYREQVLGPLAPPRAARTAPFSELNVVLYDSPTVRAAQALVSTARRQPLRGGIYRQPVAAGAATWTLTVTAVHPLVGSGTADGPWIALIAGIALAALVAAVVEAGARRRDAALALYASEHHVAETLQRSLLPDLPVLPGLELAARYLACGKDQNVGGDWFDAFALDGGRAGIVIGDVLGHDVEAAAAMSQVRAALRAYARQGHGPAEVLDRLDQMVTVFDITQLVTTFYGILGPPEPDGARVLRYANAGHLPPLVKAPGGEVTELFEAGAVLLGVPPVPGSVRTEAEIRVEPGANLLLFTDGLVETPGGSLGDALASLKETVVGYPANVDARTWCERLIVSVPSGPLRDDVAVLSVRVLPGPGVVGTEPGTGADIGTGAHPDA